MRRGSTHGGAPARPRTRVTIADRAMGRNNNFNLLRFLAAGIVILSHAYPLSRGEGTPDPLERAIGQTFGYLAVNVFFVTSGFLVTKSLVERSLVSFIQARLLRIYPGLLVAVAFCAMVLGPLFTKLPRLEYLTDPGTYAFLLRNGLCIGRLQYDLPGVFTANPYPAAINGSLWTLPWELRMYASLVVIGAFGLLRRTGPVTLLAGAGMALYVFGEIFDLSLRPFLANTVRFVAFFYAGAACWLHRSRFILDQRLVLVVVAVCLLARGTPLFAVCFAPALVYLVFVLAYLPGGWIRAFNRHGDYSYGVYIYAFPVQQAVAALWPGVTPAAMFWSASFVTVVLAALSWHFVEEPALRLKKRVGPARAERVEGSGSLG